MQDVLRSLSRVAPLDSTVLLTGESGTGKEVAARYLHESHPRRRNGEMVCLHCGAVPETLLESELFGHVRGAFTGADRDRVGKFEQADGGTLFLDEISTMSKEAQVRLLRVLQERIVTRVGCTIARPVDVRVVVATNDDLEALIDRGEFRRDLYFRIATYPIRIPALRDRPADVAPLADRFVERVAGRLGLTGGKRFDDEAMEILRAHDWPGNVRELENAVEFASIQSEGRDRIAPADLPPQLAGRAGSTGGAYPTLRVTEEGLNLRSAVTNLERELITQSLELSGGNKAKAAELLRLKRTTFLEKLKTLGPRHADPDPARAIR